jgi:Fe-S oxidoreductase
MARAATLHDAALGRRHDGGLAQDRPASALPLYACTGCGACTTACLHRVEPAQALLRGRAEAEASGAGHPALADLPERFSERAAATAASLAADAELALRVAGAGEVGLLPACLPRRQDKDAPADGPAREARAALRVCDRLRRAAPDFPRVGVVALSGFGASSGNCAGYPLYAGGFVESFRLHAESFARSVEGYAKLAVSCSACTWLLRTQYREYGVPLRPQVLHISELLAPHAPALPVTKVLPAATYHDPCHLGRRLGLYEPPRQLLRRAVGELRELLSHHAEGGCCGSGGLLPATDPALARAMAVERLSDLPPHPPSGSAEILISGCPACQHHLSKSGSVKARDLIEVLDEATSGA